MSETIIERKAGDQFEEDYKRYSVYVLFRRICPDFRDGLKPVQRRILWTMYNDTKAINRTIKSATSVGGVLKYHPHGDSSVYGAMKPMINWFEIYQPYITGQGNFGTFAGDPMAASRYTECKLNKFTLDYVFGDLKSTDKAVDWSPCYSKEAMEPDYLPSAAPMLLINGVFGIGVGLKAEIPTHNLSEVIAETLRLIKNPAYNPTLIPDHCMGCDIVDTDWVKINEQGFGNYTIRARIDIEHEKNKDMLVIKSIPNMCYLDAIVEKIEDLVAKKTITQIANAYDESSNNKIMRYVLVMKPGTDVEFVRNMLYKMTDLEQTNRINFIALNGLTPMRMSYKSYLLSFIEFRKLTKYRVYRNVLQQVQTALHEKEAYIKVLESGEIDHIIDMIKKQKNIDDNSLVEYLISKLKITDMQAKFIINANLKKLSIAYLDRYKEEANELNTRTAELTNLLIDDNAILRDIVRELKEIDKQYGGPRRCRIVAKDNDTTIPKGSVQVVVTDKNFLKKIPVGIKVGTIGDNFKQVLTLDNTDSLLIFDEIGRMFSLPVHRIPFCDKASAGTDIRYILKKFTSEIAVIFPYSVMKHFSTINNEELNTPQFFVVIASANGMTKRIDIDDVLTAPPSGVVYSKLDGGDKVSSVIITHIAYDMIIYSDNKAVRVNVSNIPYLKRNTKGNRLMQVSEGNRVEGICVIDQTVTDIVVLTRMGKINRTTVNAIEPSRKKTGNNIIKLSSKDSIAFVLGVNAADSIIVKTLYGKSLNIPVETIPGSSISSGIKIDGFDKGDCVIYGMRVSD